jgi:hypothetical protein
MKRLPGFLKFMKYNGIDDESVKNVNLSFYIGSRIFKISIGLARRIYI